MTKLDFGLGLGAKPQQDQEQMPEKEQPAAPEVTMEEVPAAILVADYKAVDWAFIYRIGNIQCSLCTISSVCMVMSIVLGGFNFMRFTSTAWMTYLLLTAYVALRAGRGRNYCHLIAFTGMVTFQTVVYMTSICWLAYSFYALDYHFQLARRTSFGSVYAFSDATLFLLVVEVLSMLATAFSGVFGLVAACRGLGKMLHDVEGLLLDRRVPSPQITLRPIV